MGLNSIQRYLEETYLVYINAITSLVIIFKFKNSIKFFRYQISIGIGCIVPIIMYIIKLIGIDIGAYLDTAYGAAIIMTMFRTMPLTLEIAENIISSDDTKMISINNRLIMITDGIGVISGVATVFIIAYALINNMFI